MSSQRLNYQQAAPKVMEALFAPGKALHGSTLEEKVRLLVAVRASQINGCAFCLHMHALELDALGEDHKRIDVLPAWRDAEHWFTPRERAALEWTEALTLVTKNGMPDDVYARVAEQFNEKERVELTLAVTEINAWNRFNVAFRTSPDAAEALVKQLHKTAAPA